MIKPLDALADEVNTRWEAVARSRAAFPALAAEALRDASLTDALTVDALIDALAAHPDLPRQVDPAGAFGEPPVTVRFEQGFALDVYFWHEPVVAVHNHSFDGAFLVLAGMSLHVDYELIEDPAPTAAQHAPVRVGDVRQTGAELLRPGDVRPIEAGLAMIHQVAHLASPCVSIVLRTTPDPADPPIYDVLPPRCALLQSRYLSEGERRKLDLIGLLFRLRGADATPRVAALLDDAPDLLAAWGVRTVAHTTQRLELANEVAAHMAPRPWLDPLLESMAASDVARVHWKTLPDPNHRLFAMLAHYVPDPDTRDAIVDQLEPGELFERAAIAWTVELSNAGYFPVALNQLAIVTLGALLAGLDDPEAAQAMAPHFDGGPPEGLEGYVAQMRTFFNSIPLYQALLAEVG